MRTRLLGISLFFSLLLSVQAQDPTIRMKTTLGDIDVTLLQSVAPNTVNNFLKYMNRGAFNNTMFHRSVRGFIIQTGGWTYNSQFVKIPADAPIRNEYQISNTRGTLAMAKLDGNPNSATTEFFFNLADNSANLNNQNGGFTVFGKVANDASLRVMDAIANQPIISFGQFNELPAYNYRGGTVQAGNIILIQSMTPLEPLPQPSISPNGVQVAAAFGGGTKAAPGSYLEIYGANLAGTSRGWTDADFSGSVAPVTLENVQATVGGVRAFINYISPGQINIQIPEGVQSGDSVPVVISYIGASTAATNIAIRDYNGGLLAPPSFKVGDTQYVAALHSATGKFVSGGNIPNVDNDPAVRGEILLFYGLGFGPITPNFPPLGGRKATGQTTLTNPVTVKFGDAEAKVLYQGLAPGFIGLYQFNVEVPSNAPTGDQPLTFIQGGDPIAQKLTISIKAAQ
jgi:uncharacterized protein (TIGR03437 family)